MSTAQATPAPTAPLPAQTTGADVPALQAQVAELQVQRAGLKAQWDGLRVQLDNMLRTNPARPGVQQQWADVGVEMAKVEGNIATLNARIAQKQGLPVGAPTIPVPPRQGINPGVAIPVTALLVILIFPVSYAWARRILRRAPQPAPVPSDVTMRLERIEQAIDTVAIEVERISEGQRFVTRIMAARPSAGAQAAAASPDDAASQMKPPLALGAGAMEPIVVPERERVRQRVITPH